MAYSCACCGAPIAEPSPIEALKHANVGPLVGRAIEVLSAIYPHTISRDDLADMVYVERRGGGPHWANSSIGVMIYRANKTLAKSGWRIGASAMGKRDDIGLRPLS